MQDPIAEALLHAPLAIVPAWWSAQARASDDWARFERSWEDLQQDAHMADGGTYRLRRYATFRATCATGTPSMIAMNPHAPHFQLREDNPVHGGVERFFAPMRAETVQNPLFVQTVRRSMEVFTACERAAGRSAEWYIEAHQFRIHAQPHATAYPTPEGMHSDGRDYVFMMLLDRHNIAGGQTTVCSRDHSVLYCDTITEPGTAVLLDDRHALHAVSPVHSARAGTPAHRDVLVLTFCNTRRPGALLGVKKVPEKGARPPFFKRCQASFFAPAPPMGLTRDHIFVIAAARHAARQPTRLC